MKGPYRPNFRLPQPLLTLKDPAGSHRGIHIRTLRPRRRAATTNTCKEELGLDAMFKILIGISGSSMDVSACACLEARRRLARKFCMTNPAPMIKPARRRYSGQIPCPERWASFAPRRGDIIVCTPSKSGTTWTQTILAMLLHRGPDLPMKMPVLSPWIDADLGIPESEVSAALSAQKGRRVVKTHTPLDGFSDWEGVTVVTVYRHPLDVYFSLRKHYANMTITRDDDPMVRPLPESIHSFLCGKLDLEDYSSKTLESIAAHFCETLQTDRTPGPDMLHYADMIADSRQAVVRLAEIAKIDADDELIDVVAKATSFGSMKAKAADYAPAGGTGLFRSDSNFFDSAQSRKWQGRMTQEALALYDGRLSKLIPDAKTRSWLQFGDAGQPSA